MQRSSFTPAIVLSLKAAGENNTTVTLLTPDKGIVYATLYGGPKSRFRSLIGQFNIGKIWLYDNPEKNQTKISDFEPESFHLSFSQSLYKMYAASLACELAIKTHCAGSNEQTFYLIKGFLDGMDLCNEEQSKLGLIRFLWRYLQLLGIQPEINFCSICNKSFFNSQFTIDSLFYYNISDNSFVCSECLNQLKDYSNSGTSYTFELTYGALFYLYGISNFAPKDVRNLHITKVEYEQLKQLVLFLIENNAGTKLNSIETAVGIL